MSATNDEGGGFRRFYAACDGVHREFFSAVIADWREAGQPCDAQDGVARLRIRSLASADEDGLPVLFSLVPAGGIEPARMCWELDRWRAWLREEDLDRMLRELRALDGVEPVVRAAGVCIESPGALSGPVQHELRTLLRRWAHAVQELLGG
ncbi:MAG: hypothetical protein R8K47_08000 [Mariprofundaceae bacterium]